MRILLTGGGSGGHTFPLVAVARKLIAQEQNELELLFIGPNGETKDIFSKEGINAKPILAGKMRRYFSLLNLIDILKFPISLLQAYWHIFWFMPDVVFSKGGYGSVPALLIAWLFRIPVVIHESDSIAGTANKIFFKFAKKIILSFSDTDGHFPNDKTIVLGNPIRDGLFSITKEQAQKKLVVNSEFPLLLIMGGSRGAKQINDILLLSLPNLIERYEIIHQCGEANYKELQRASLFQIKSEEDRRMYHLYPELNEEELGSAYLASSIIISRAGSGAIFEIARSGKPSILIPYIFGAGKHQERNVHTYAKAGAAVVLEGKNLTPHMLISAVDSIINNSEKAEAMSKAALEFAKPQAAAKIAETILATIDNKLGE